MSPSTILPRLPDELIIEIFRNRDLSQEDLYSCSLVSRRFTEEVNKCLYEKVTIVLASGGDGESTRYTDAAWKLLRTLVDVPGLSDGVRAVFLEVEGCDEERIHPMEITEHQLLSAILRLARNLKEISLGPGWPREEDDWEVIKSHQQIEALSLCSFTLEELNFIGQHLPRIKHLSGILETQPTATPTSYPQGLETLRLSDEDRNTHHAAFIAANSSTLRHLSVNVDVGLVLNYSAFPNLSTLYLHSGTCRPEYLSQVRGKCSAFWSSIATSSSLRTLSLPGRRFPQRYEDELFHKQRGPSKPIPTLRTLRFEGDILLDRTNVLLSGPIATTLHRVTIPSHLSIKDSTPVFAHAAEFVIGICEKKGIEVVYSDEEE